MDIDYFITKLSAIPEDTWTLSADGKDVWEWLTTEEAEALYGLVRPYGILLEANDDEEEEEYAGDTPKQRILSFLDFIKSDHSPYIHYEGLFHDE